MWNNIVQNNGWATSIGGILTVFGGLVLIACSIYLFNRILEMVEAREGKRASEKLPPFEQEAIQGPDISQEKEIPMEDRIAIATLIELYRRVHFDAVQSDVTFVRGNDAQNAWRLGFKYGQH